MDYRISEVETILDYKFNNSELLRTALTHSSYANDYLGDAHLGNERLEFLGDAFLDLVVGEDLYARFPDKQEGFLSKLRAEIVCEESLATVAVDFKLNEFLRLGKGEEAKGGRNRRSIIADMTEAVIAAVYLDGGYEPGKKAVHRLMDKIIEEGCIGKLPGDSKTQLQEYFQKHGLVVPEYRLLEETGPDHDKTFIFGVYKGEKLLAKGSGKTKKLAEQEAAKEALSELLNK